MWHHICIMYIESDKKKDMNYNELNFDAMTREQGLSMSTAFPALMRKVYVWMALALVITGATAYGVATSPGVMMTLYSNQLLFWGLIIAEFDDGHVDVYLVFRDQWCCAFLDLFDLYDVEYCQRVLYHSGYVLCDGSDRLYHKDRPHFYG